MHASWLLFAEKKQTNKKNKQIFVSFLNHYNVMFYSLVEKPVLGVFNFLADDAISIKFNKSLFISGIQFDNINNLLKFCIYYNVNNQFVPYRDSNLFDENIVSDQCYFLFKYLKYYSYKYLIYYIYKYFKYYIYKYFKYYTINILSIVIINILNIIIINIFKLYL